MVSVGIRMQDWERELEMVGILQGCGNDLSYLIRPNPQSRFHKSEVSKVRGIHSSRAPYVRAAEQK